MIYLQCALFFRRQWTCTCWTIYDRENHLHTLISMQRTTIMCMVHKMKCSQNICDTKDNVHRTHKQEWWGFAHTHTHTYSLLPRTSTLYNHSGCNGNCMGGIIVEDDLHPNLSIAPTHVVAMSENWGCIWDYNCLATIAKSMAANVKMVIHSKICNMGGP